MNEYARHNRFWYRLFLLRCLCHAWNLCATSLRPWWQRWQETRLWHIKNTHTLLLGREELEKYEFRLLPVLGLPQEEIGYRRLRFSVVYRRRVQLSMRFDVNISSHQNIEEREAY